MPIGSVAPVGSYSRGIQTRCTGIYSVKTRVRGSAGRGGSIPRGFWGKRGTGWNGGNTARFVDDKDRQMERKPGSCRGDGRRGKDSSEQHEEITRWQMMMAPVLPIVA